MTKSDDKMDRLCDLIANKNVNQRDILKYFFSTGTIHYFNVKYYFCSRLWPQWVGVNFRRYIFNAIVMLIFIHQVYSNNSSV